MNLHLVRSYLRYYRTPLAVHGIFVCLLVTLYLALNLAALLRSGRLPPIEFLWGALPLLFMLLFAVTNIRAMMLTRKIASGIEAMRHGDYAEAETMLREALILAERSAPDDPCRGEVLEYLTLATRLQGNCDSAESLCQQWLEVQEKAWGKQHPRTLRALEKLAEIYLQIAHYAQARDVLERALQGRTAQQRKAPVPLAICLNMLGELWCELGRFDKAEPCFRQAIALIQHRRESKPHEWRTIALNLASCCRQHEELDEAEFLCQAALEQARRMEQPESLPVAQCLHQLASVKRAQGDLEQAEEILRRSLEIGQHRLALRGGRQLLAAILREQGKWEEADCCYRESLQLCEKYLAPIHLATASVLEEYADLLELMGRTEEAENLQQRAKQIRDFHSPFRLV